MQIPRTGRLAPMATHLQATATQLGAGVRQPALQRCQPLSPAMRRRFRQTTSSARQECPEYCPRSSSGSSMLPPHRLSQLAAEDDTESCEVLEYEHTPPEPTTDGASRRSEAAGCAGWGPRSSAPCRVGYQVSVGAKQLVTLVTLVTRVLISTNWLYGSKPFVGPRLSVSNSTVERGTITL